VKKPAFYLNCLDDDDRENISRLAEAHGVKFSTLIAHLVRTGIRRRAACARYAKSPRGKRTRERAKRSKHSRIAA
jgi:hypothetical protein